MVHQQGSALMHMQDFAHAGVGGVEVVVGLAEASVAPTASQWGSSDNDGSAPAAREQE